jgi:surface antigen
MRYLTTLILGLSASVTTSVQAQYLPGWESQISLTRQDFDMIDSALKNRIHGKPVGTTASWSNPTSGNSGSIKLIKKLVLNRQKCEDLEYTNRSGPPIHIEHLHFTSCLQPDGTWKLA